MKKSERRRTESFLSNDPVNSVNPMMDEEALVDLPIINAQAYDVPLPYCDTTMHMRGVRNATKDKQVQ